MNIYDEQLAKMLRLMSTGKVNENNTSKNNNIVEYHALGADGKTYGIVKEGAKYYIKNAPKKDTEILEEDYDYIGGFLNKKDYEYNSYANASKNLDFKLMSLNEAYNQKEPIVQAFDPYKKMDVIIEQTDKMKNEIERQRQIILNTASILNEDSKISTKNVGVPEAPKTASNSTNQNAPFTEKATAKLDKDNVTKSSSYKKQAPFNEDGEVTDADMQSDKNPKGGANTDSPHTEAAKYVPNGSVANQKPKGGKVVKVNEDKHKIKMTEDQVLTWNKNQDYLDTSTETNIGSSAPFDKKIGCSSTPSNDTDDTIDEDVAAMWQQGDNINSPTPGNGEIGDTAPFDETVKEEGEDEEPMNEDLASNYAGFGGEEGEYGSNDLDFEREWQSWLTNGGDRDFEMQQQQQRPQRPDDFRNEPSLEDENPTRMQFDPSYGMDNPYDDRPMDYNSKKPKKAVKEEKLDVFGKTPGYRKKPMTLPSNSEVAPNGAKDWNDSSVEGEEPFGQKIGSSAPFTDLVKDITNAVVTAITNMNMDKKKV